MIIFDLDGTLSLVGSRLKYLTQPKKDWKSFYAACEEDEINEPIAAIFRTLLEDHYIKIVTGRREDVREKTINWLIKNDLFIGDENLHMRGKNDYRRDEIVKVELIKDFQNEITAIFEDRNSMVIKWRELGFTCLQVADGNF